MIILYTIGFIISKYRFTFAVLYASAKHKTRHLNAKTDEENFIGSNCVISSMGRVGLEPTRLSTGVFKTPAAAISPPPHCFV
jgi:hypothetical protein